MLVKQCKIQQLTIGTGDSFPALILHEDYVKYALKFYPDNRCVGKFLNTVLPSIQSFAVEKCTLKQKFKLQQYELT